MNKNVNIDNDLVRRAREAAASGAAIENQIEKDVDKEFFELGLDKDQYSIDLAATIPLITEFQKNNPGVDTVVVCYDKDGKMVIRTHQSWLDNQRLKKRKEKI